MRFYQIPAIRWVAKNVSEKRVTAEEGKEWLSSKLSILYPILFI